MTKGLIDQFKCIRQHQTVNLASTQGITTPSAVPSATDIAATTGTAFGCDCAAGSYGAEFVHDGFFLRKNGK